MFGSSAFFSISFCGIKDNSYICGIKYSTMPEIFRFFGFSFFFYSKEHEPVHVHVEGASGFAKFDYDGNAFVLNKAQGLKTGELKKIKEVIDENTDIIMARWDEYFNR